MKKVLFSIFVGLFAGLANAGDFVNHTNNKIQNIPQTHVQVINFWAAWCKPCRKEIARYEQMVHTNRQKAKSRHGWHRY